MGNITNWGIGMILDDNGEVQGYGFPEDLNPKHFCPDYEMCSEEEIKNHEEAENNIKEPK